MPAEGAAATVALLYGGLGLLALLVVLQGVALLRRPPDPGAAFAPLIERLAERLGARLDSAERALGPEVGKSHPDKSGANRPSRVGPRRMPTTS